MTTGLVAPYMVYLAVNGDTTGLRVAPTVPLVLVEITLLLAFVYYREYKRRKQFLLNRALKSENKMCNRLTYNLVPPTIALKLRRGYQFIVEQYADASVLYADITGFTPLSASLPTIQLVEFLKRMFCAFDDLCEEHTVYKVNTIGDCYVVVAGIPAHDPYHAESAIEYARHMLRTLKVLRVEMMEESGNELLGNVAMRVGVHSGPMTAGVVGVKSLRYEVWGETANEADRLQTNGTPMRICVSPDCYAHVRYTYHFEGTSSGAHMLIETSRRESDAGT